MTYAVSFGILLSSPRGVAEAEEVVLLLSGPAFVSPADDYCQKTIIVFSTGMPAELGQARNQHQELHCQAGLCSNN